MPKYPDSICEAHRNVTASEPVCIVCMNEEVERLRARVAELGRLIADDAFAMTFQSMGQYRAALIKAIRG